MRGSIAFATTALLLTTITNTVLSFSPSSSSSSSRRSISSFGTLSDSQTAWRAAIPYRKTQCHQPANIKTLLLAIQKPDFDGSKDDANAKTSLTDHIRPSQRQQQRPFLSSLVLRWSMSTMLFFSVITSSLSPTLFSSISSSSSSSSSLIAWASDYNSLSDEQKLVAEAWRLVDNSFLDRTFANQDWWNVRELYVKQRKYKSMEEAHAAIAEFTATLQDPYTRYLTPSKYQSLVDSATGTLAGVGMEISLSPPSTTSSTSQEEKYIFASDVEPNSPASRAGIQPGDRFVQIAGTNVMVVPLSTETSLSSSTSSSSPSSIETVASTPEEVAALIRGPPNSKVSVVMERQGKKYDYILTREPITITSVSSYVLPHVNGWNGKVGVIRIKNFSGTTASTVATKIDDLEQKQGVTALVLDLRSNPGGLLPGGVDTASLFLEANKPVVFVVDKKGVVTSSASLADGMDLTTPLIVLVNANTASAAEVVSAALQEDARAVIVGQQTFGKGIVQTIRSLQEGKEGGLAITVARYETPLHHDINKQGVIVDVSAPVDCPKNDVSACLPAAAFAKAQELIQK